MALSEKELLQLIIDDYVNSSDFNGVLASLLAIQVGLEIDALKKQIACLLKQGKVSIVVDDCNIYIKRFEPLPVGEQLIKLNKTDANRICIYPSELSLRSTVDASKYIDMPFKKRLYLGEPKLKPFFFDLKVLEPYLSDPRYDYQFQDYCGSISVHDVYYETEQMPERDKVLLQSFGIARDSNGNRIVVVYLCYLSDLTPEHQQIWNAHLHQENDSMSYKDMHFEYYQTSILAEWPDYVSVYQAILEEQSIINRMARSMGKPLFFKNEYENHRPPEFAPALRPTLRNYETFVHVLDKMLSDNINKDFFKGEVPFEEDITDAKGNIRTQQVGSITMLDRYLRKRIRFQDPSIYDDIIEPFKDVRKFRQKPAHAISMDVFDPAYVDKQDELVKRVYTSLRYLRIALGFHPANKEIKIPDWLEDARIKVF